MCLYTAKFDYTMTYFQWVANIKECVQDGRLVHSLPGDPKVINFPQDCSLQQVMPTLIADVVNAVETASVSFIGKELAVDPLVYDRYKLYINFGKAVTDIHSDDTAAWNIILFAAYVEEPSSQAQAQAQAQPSTSQAQANDTVRICAHAAANRSPCKSYVFLLSYRWLLLGFLCIKPTHPR